MKSSDSSPPSKGVKVAVAMSGGVDSSVAAALLVQSGYGVLGLMMRLWSEPSTNGPTAVNRCCTPDQMADARRVAGILDIPFYAIDAQDLFRKQVVDYFVDTYEAGQTPNPCIRCNQLVRFGFLLEYALTMGAEYLATGHYARLGKDARGKVQLLQAADHGKDQSYALYALNQEQLRRIIFPIGDYTKNEVRELASSFRLPVASKKESMDLCFIADGDPQRFLSNQPTLNATPGPILSSVGVKLGEHDGLPFYTIGQRKGLNISAGEPLYVLSKQQQANALIVGTKEELGKRILTVHNTNWISGHPPRMGERTMIMIRYRAIKHPAIVIESTDSEVTVEFREPLHGITAGQSAVFYDNLICIGGGVIMDKEQP